MFLVPALLVAQGKWVGQFPCASPVVGTSAKRYTDLSWRRRRARASAIRERIRKSDQSRCMQGVRKS